MASSCVRACSRYPRVLHAQNGICLPPGSRNSLQHFIRFFWLNVQGSMKSCSMTIKMFLVNASTSNPLGRLQAAHESANCCAAWSEPGTAEEDHNPSRAVLISTEK